MCLLLRWTRVRFLTGSDFLILFIITKVYYKILLLLPAVLFRHAAAAGRHTVCVCIYVVCAQCACVTEEKNSNAKSESGKQHGERDMAAGVSWSVRLLVALLLGCGTEALWWPFSSDEVDEKRPTAAAPAPPSGPVAFEMNSAEQKFLAEAQAILNLPPLEACQHQV